MTAEAKNKAGSEAKWGFLKNIVNIDTFFSSGSDSSSPKKDKEVEEKPSSDKTDKKQAKTKMVSSSKKAKKNTNQLSHDVKAADSKNTIAV